MWRVCPVLLLLSWLCVTASAQETCPWLTEGTAAALLGGSVNETVHASAGEGSCEFVRERVAAPNSGTNGTLIVKITVGHQRPLDCVQGERILGVGEDATWCMADAAGKHREIVRGRVRSTWFLLTLTASGAIARDKALLRRSLEQIGEEVAGNLF